MAAADVGAAHPDLPDNLERTASHCWDSDPFAKGAHAAPGPGQLTLVQRLSDPEGRIHFAGEHLSDRPGWMEGAIISGLRAARELG
jgi:monoamine oxidase